MARTKSNKISSGKSKSSKTSKDVHKEDKGNKVVGTTPKKSSMLPIFIVILLVVAIGGFLFFRKNMSNQGTGNNQAVTVAQDETLKVAQLKEGLVKDDDGSEYYIKEDGNKATNEWIRIGENWYYFDGESKKAKMQIIDNEYFVDEEGKVKHNFWYKNPDNQKYYYFGDDGELLKNSWIKDGDDWYYVDDTGAMVVDKWIDNVYRVDADGKMLKNTVTPDGYVVGEDGKFFDLDAYNQFIQAQAKAQAQAASGLFGGKRPSVGQTVTMGKCQGASLQWTVLDVNPGKALLLCKNIVDYQKYNNSFVNTTWAQSYARSWLNSTFFSSAFSNGTSGYVVATSVQNLASVHNQTNAGISTRDKVFLLSLPEIEAYQTILNNCGAMSCTATTYAKSKNPTANDYHWCTRTPGTSQKEVAFVESSGSINFIGRAVDLLTGIRPAVWVRY